jgi:WD40 repeat protein
LSLADPTYPSEVGANGASGPAARPQLPAFQSQRRDPERYKALGEHGRGGIGVVSRAHDHELGRDIAIKELLVHDRANEARFLREALITARLEHPGIVPVYEAGRWPDGTPFYAMKLVSGRSLRDLLAERTTVEQRIGLLHHVIAVADAIAYAHGRQIIHRDLKPANVIAGEFGETIVIDWGLAKDLTSAEEPTADDGPFRNQRSQDLTSAGSILGTPAYMAPEQRRGEPVDQRADVYAIGVMLWELCTVRKEPPDTAQLRRRALRRTGIDQDLATIIDKALDLDPARRYPDAGPLAADLKAFKAGARIAARSYSLLARIAHWTRRHRALAALSAAAVAIAATSGVLYVRNLAERDRADAADAAARRARASAEASLDELTLKHAQFLLATDPSAAIEALARYQGPDRDRADQIRAEATGRGVALLRALPHTDTVPWTHAVADGAIVSLSGDGTIARTSRDGGSVVLARGVSKRGVSTYAPARQLLAYACDPSDVCLFDVARAAPIPVASALRGANASGMSFSPDGSLLGLISQASVLTIFDITDPVRPVLRLRKETDHGLDVEFVAGDAVVVGSGTGVAIVRMNRGEERFALPDLAAWAVNATEHAVALATMRGEAVALDSLPLRVAARAKLCSGPITSLDFVPGRRSIAYGCTGGAIGLWELQRGAARPRAQLVEGNAYPINASASGDYVVAAGGNGTVAVLDLSTDLMATYKGHGFRLTSLTPPTPDHPFVISGDARGAVQVWPLPPRLARVAATASSPFLAAIFDRQSATVIATTRLPALTVVSPSAGVRSVEPHAIDSTDLERSSDGSTFATYGSRDTVELWSAATMKRTRVVATGLGAVWQLQFVADTDEFITASSGGRLIRWTPSGQPTPLAQVDLPIVAIAQAPAAGAIVFATEDGALWRTGATGQAIPVKPRGPRVNRILALPDRSMVYAGDANGDVFAIDTRTWRPEPVLHGSGGVREIAVTRDGHIVAVATNDGTIHIGTRDPDAASTARLTWVTFAARARHIALAPDGVLVAACTDGAIWLYSAPLRRWSFLSAGVVDFVRTVIADDGNAAAVLDAQGRLLWLDLDAARRLLATASGTQDP